MRLKTIASNITDTIEDRIEEASIGIYLGLFVGVIGFAGYGLGEACTRLTTKSIKEYNIHINQIDTIKMGSVRSYILHVEGDTAGKMEDYPGHQFEVGKEYNCRIRRYGLIFHNESIEKVKEIRK